MKVVNKARIKHRRYEKLTLSEKDILAQIHSNYIVCLKYAYHTPIDVYLVLDLMTGMIIISYCRLYIHICTCLYLSYIYTLYTHIHVIYTHLIHILIPYIHILVIYTLTYTLLHRR